MTKKQTDLKVSDLKPAEYNPRYISDEKLEMLEKSMKVYGDLSGIVFNKKTGNLIGGHQRLKNFDASKIVHIEPVTDKTGTVGLGYIETPSGRFQVRLVEWDLTTEKAANIAANKQGGQWDFDKLKDLLTELDHENYDMYLTGFDGEELENLLNDSFLDKYADTASIDEIEEDENVNLEPPKEPITKEGDLYELNGHRLLCGDSENLDCVKLLMNDKKADCVFTDPPYGVSYQSNVRVKSDKFEVLKNDDVFLEKWISFLPLVSQGFVFIWTSWKVLNKWIEICSPIGDLTNLIIWNKAGGGIGDLKKTYATDFEIALVYNRGSSLTGKRIGSVWSVGKDSANKYLHPTQKPLQLVSTALQTVTKKEDIVLDFFLGSGSTLLASEQLNRKCYGLELDPKYCDVIVRRWVTHMRENDKEFTVIKNGKKLTLDQISKYLV